MSVVFVFHNLQNMKSNFKDTVQYLNLSYFLNRVSLKERLRKRAFNNFTLFNLTDRLTLTLTQLTYKTIQIHKFKKI